MKAHPSRRSGAVRRAGGVRAWSSSEPTGVDIDDLSPQLLLDRLFRLQPRHWLRRIPGRQTFVWPGEPGRVVKRFSGGEPRDFWYDRFHGIARSPARREAENLLRLAQDGIPVPRALAYVEEAAATRNPRFGGREGRSVLVMECVRHREDLRQALARADAPGRRALLELLVELVSRLHARGWVHRDLYLQHFVIPADGPPSLALLDVGRARREGAHRRRWFVKDLAALLHSAPPGVTRPDRLRFLRSWLRARGSDSRGERGRWARSILTKARRIAAHAPRHVDPRTAGTRAPERRSEGPE